VTGKKKRIYIKLIEQARQGNEDALEELCRKIEQVIKSYFSTRYNNVDVIQELSQETYLRFLKSFPNLKEPQKFSYFIAKIALHVHQDYLQKKYQSIENIEENVEEPSIGHVAKDVFVLHPESEIENRIDWEAAFQQLPERTQKILRMKLDGVGYYEIGKSLNLTLSAVKMIVARGLKKLKSFL